MVRTFAGVRSVLVYGFLFLFAGFVHAQEQEKKLLDRLLKPDMTMQNDAEKKQFVVGGAEPTTKKATTKWFLFGKRKPEKGFWNTQQIAAKEFSTADSRDANKTANLSTRTRIAKADVAYSAPMYGDIRTARDGTKSMTTSDYPGSRPFTLKGKSQKSLSAQDQPLTIDQVRELLNKNK